MTYYYCPLEHSLENMDLTQVSTSTPAGGNPGPEKRCHSSDVTLILAMDLDIGPNNLEIGP